MKIKKIIPIFLLSLFLLACSNEETTVEEPATEEVVETEEEEDMEEESFLRESDYSLLKKSFADLTTTEKQRMAEIRNELDNLTEEEYKKVKGDLDRLEKQEEESLKEPAVSYDLDPEAGKIYRFSPGLYGMENNLEIPEAGSFHFAFEGKGNFTIRDPYGNEYYSTTIDSENSIPRVYGFLFDGWEFETDEDLITKMQFNEGSLGYTEHELFRGVWNIEEDLAAGKYFLTALESDILPEDDFVLYHTRYNMEKDEDEILKEYHSPVEREEIELQEGESLKILGINKILLEVD